MDGCQALVEVLNFVKVVGDDFYIIGVYKVLEFVVVYSQFVFVEVFQFVVDGIDCDLFKSVNQFVFWFFNVYLDYLVVCVFYKLDIIVFIWQDDFCILVDYVLFVVVCYNVNLIDEIFSISILWWDNYLFFLIKVVLFIVFINEISQCFEFNIVLCVILYDIG